MCSTGPQADVEMLTDSSELQHANLPRQTAEQQQVLPVASVSSYHRIHCSYFFLPTAAMAVSDPPNVQAKELLQRKSQLIMKLTTAGADLDSVIKDNKHELDEVLLKMLEKRAEAAYK